MFKFKYKAVHKSELETTFTPSTAKLACCALVASTLILKSMVAAGTICPQRPEISG